MKRSLCSLAVIATFAALFVADHAYGVEGAHNVIKFWVYASLVYGVIAVLINPDKPMPARPALLRWITGSANMAIIIAFAWYGQFDYAAIWAFSSISAQIYREKSERIGAAA
jgi:hypothetical protein